jgi:hypothetical protein
MRGFSGSDARVADHIVGAPRPIASFTTTARDAMSNMGSISSEKLRGLKRKESALAVNPAGAGSGSFLVAGRQLKGESHFSGRRFPSQPLAPQGDPNAFSE